ncbi:hypothetical protein COOONC_00867 [Cooperia oncophora]
MKNAKFLILHFSAPSKPSKRGRKRRKPENVEAVHSNKKLAVGEQSISEAVGDRPIIKTPRRPRGIKPGQVKISLFS